MKAVVDAIKAEIRASKQRIEAEQVRISNLKRTLSQLGISQNSLAPFSKSPGTLKTKARRPRPSDIAIQSGVVTTGGRFKDIAGTIVSILNGTQLTSAEISKRVYQPGLGIKRSEVKKRVCYTLSRLKKDGTLESSPYKGKGHIWSVTKANNAN